jgi:hypothetical protein
MACADLDLLTVAMLIGDRHFLDIWSPNAASASL